MSPPSEPTTDSLDPLLRRVIADNFRIEKLIGSGAMGNVYKAEQISLGKAVAVKVLHTRLMSDDKLVMRFKREAKSASLLNHPNSIQIIDSGQDRDGTLYIAMELLNGRDLAHVIRDDFPLPLPRVVRIVSQVLSALDEAHAQGIIHRDLKPSNIMLIERRGETDFVKVCDFGIAKATQDSKDDRAAMLTIQGLVCGTPEYMAPEQARAETLDGRADLYAAAVILYQMMTGDIPFKGDSPMAIVSRHLAEMPIAPSRKRPDLAIPQSIDALIMRGMEKNRESRFPTAVAFREELEAIGSGNTGRYTPAPPNLSAAMPTARMPGLAETAVVPSSDPPLRPGSTARMYRERRPFPLFAGVAVLALAVGAVAAVAVLRSQRVGDRAQDPVKDQARDNDNRPSSAREASFIAPLPHAAAGASAATAATATTAPALVVPLPAAAAPPPEPAPAPAIGEPGAPPRPAAASRVVRRKKGPDHPPPVGPAGAEGSAVAAAPAAARPAVAAPATAPDPSAAPALRGAREIVTEGEKLLGQGEVGDACLRGEEAKRANPKLALAYKFLGKCYMRAGNASRANDNYKKYLELAPDASDAMFIKSIIK